jgi:hypothetical protein
VGVCWNPAKIVVNAIIATKTYTLTSQGLIRIVSGLAGKTLTQSSATVARPDTANGCLVLRKQEPRREAQLQADETAETQTRAPHARREILAPLDKDLSWMSA